MLLKTIAKRSFIVFLLVAVVVSGFGILGVRFAINGERWTTLRANEHLTENGSFIAAGNIVDRNGVVLAKTENNQRVYNDSERIRRSTLHIVGDTEGYISSGVQTAYKTELIGYNPVTGIYSLKKHGRGNDVKLTIDSEVSAVAYDALKGKKGVVTAYNYKTGEIICSVSAPNYDVRSKPDESVILENKNGEYEGIYLNRLIDGLYTPGSVFKIITTACALENNVDVNGWSYECKGEDTVGGVKVTCPHSHGKLDFKAAFANSCNGAYATLADELGAVALNKTAQEFGFGKSFDFGVSKTAASRFDVSDASSGDLAWAGVGQYTTLVNPYHMLTVLGAIANEGKAVMPYVVDNVSSPSGKVLEKTEKAEEEYISANVANLVGELMRNNVVEKYGDNRFSGLSMCGKTGTAEVGDDAEPHSWFVGFSQKPSCPVAIVVVVENGGWGSQEALPVASTVMNSIYKSLS